MPGPLSVNAMRGTPASVLVTQSSIHPPSGVNFSALPSRFRTACISRPRSASTHSDASGHTTFTSRARSDASERHSSTVQSMIGPSASRLNT